MINAVLKLWGIAVLLLRRLERFANAARGDRVISAIFDRASRDGWATARIGAPSFEVARYARSRLRMTELMTQQYELPKPVKRA